MISSILPPGSTLFVFIVVFQVLVPANAALHGPLPSPDILPEGLTDDKGERYARLTRDLHRPRVRPDLAPAHRLIGAGAGIATVELGCRVDEDREVRAVPHEVGVAGMVLGQPPPQDDHPGRVGAHGEVVDEPHVPGDVEHEAGALEGVEVHHVAHGPIGEGGAEDGYGIAGGPG